MKHNTLSLRFDETSVSVIDQTLLPHQEIWVDVTDPKACVEAIQSLRVRGAPLIGVVASLCLGIFCRNNSATDDRLFWWHQLIESRPTAVNLMHLMNILKPMIVEQKKGDEIFLQAVKFFSEDQAKCDEMASVGLEIIKGQLQLGLDSQKEVRLLTHCNTGALATAGEGTALAVIKKVAKVYSKTLVYVDETRPLLQGARLTAWELKLSKVKHKLICDNMAGFLMLQNKVDAVLVGADRITAQGDSANKIGTYSLAVLCHHHKIPFYIVAPTTTIDSSLSSGSEIPIEERNPEEVRKTWADPTTEVYNPAFDWVPHELITGWITEDGYFENKDIEQGAFQKYFKTVK